MVGTHHKHVIFIQQYQPPKALRYGREPPNGDIDAALVELAYKIHSAGWNDMDVHIGCGGGDVLHQARDYGRAGKVAGADREASDGAAWIKCLSAQRTGNTRQCTLHRNRKLTRLGRR